MVRARGCDVGFHRFFWGRGLISNVITADLIVVDSQKRTFGWRVVQVQGKSEIVATGGGEEEWTA